MAEGFSLTRIWKEVVIVWYLVVCAALGSRWEGLSLGNLACIDIALIVPLQLVAIILSCNSSEFPMLKVIVSTACIWALL